MSNCPALARLVDVHGREWRHDLHELIEQQAR